MSWKAGVSRNLPILRFFACPKSPSSNGIMSWYKNNYDTLKKLNPTLPLLLRTADNAMPAITTEIDFTTNDLIRYMVQTNRFQNEDGSPAADRIEAGMAYLNTDWTTIRYERFASPGFDPEHPYIQDIDPDWKQDPNKRRDLSTYLGLKEVADEQFEIIKSGPNNEYTKAENSLLMCQRVDLWCAGEAEVESAIRHLVMLGKRFNSNNKHEEMEDTDRPDFITEFYPGASDF